MEKACERCLQGNITCLLGSTVRCRRPYSSFPQGRMAGGRSGLFHVVVLSTLLSRRTLFVSVFDLLKFLVKYSRLSDTELKVS